MNGWLKGEYVYTLFDLSEGRGEEDCTETDQDMDTDMDTEFHR